MCILIILTLYVYQWGTQDSVLEPLLFLILINDFSSNVPLNTVLFADDKTFINSYDNLQTLLSDCGEVHSKAINWFSANNEITANKLFKCIFSLRNLCDRVPYKSLQTAYFGMFYSRLT